MAGTDGATGTPPRPVRSAGAQDVAAATSGWGPAQDTTMVELQDTHGCSFGGGQETELRRIRRTGVYALLNELAVSLACKEMDAG